MTARHNDITPQLRPNPKPWSLDELGNLVKDFLEYARKGIEWKDVDIAAAGRNNYAAIDQYISGNVSSDKYRPHIDLHYFERIDGHKEEAVVLAYCDRNGEEIGRLKIIRA